MRQHRLLSLLLLPPSGILPGSRPWDHPRKGHQVFQALLVACKGSSPLYGPGGSHQGPGDGSGHCLEWSGSLACCRVPQLHPSLQQLVTPSPWLPCPSHSQSGGTSPGLVQILTIWGHPDLTL